jgi:16S rRNA (cytosine1402-N4)-methyltransferase
MTAADAAPSEGVPHIPVLLAEVVAALAPVAGETYIDGTFGAGGYARAILDAAACNVLALDRDGTAVRGATAICKAYPNRLTVVESPFGVLDEVARVYLSTGSAPGKPSVFSPPDGVVLDIGVSSMQLDQAARGFSFQHDGPLDMRMSQSGQYAGPSAADIVNTASEERLADILFHLGDERRARQIARAIVHDRAKTPFTRTKELAGLVARILKTPVMDGRHAATRTFQALRIAVNDELGELARGLMVAERILKPGGRLAVVTFHSLEDGIVKRFFRQRTGREPAGSRHLPQTVAAAPAPSFRFVNHRPVTPSEGEIARNPRARSARLRWAVRTEAPAWPESAADLGVPALAD